jgi:hypothetical protein
VGHQRDERLLVDAQLLVKRGHDRRDYNAKISHVTQYLRRPSGLFTA